MCVVSSSSSFMKGALGVLVYFIVIYRDTGPSGKTDSLRPVPILGGFEIHDVICQKLHSACVSGSELELLGVIW